MSVKAVGWAFEQRLPPTQKIVLLALADFAGERHECWPSMETLAKMASLTSRSVRSTIRALEDLGLVTTQVRVRPNGSQTSNVYTLAVGAEDSSGGPGKLLPPQEPSYEPDLTKTSRDQSRPMVGRASTESVLSPVEKVLAGQAGIASIGVVIDVISIHCQRDVTASAALRVALEILNNAKGQVAAPGRYVGAAIRREPFVWQKYIDENSLV
jgi:hypothetical protein